MSKRRSNFDGQRIDWIDNPYSGECPWCGGKNCEGQEVDILIQTARQEVSCLACGKHWFLVFHLGCAILVE